MSDGEAAPIVEVAVAPAEPMSVDDAIQAVLKKALSHDGLVRGLHEVVRALEKGQAQLTFLAEDSDQPEYKKLVEALCKERSVPLISIPARKQLGQFCGLCKVDDSGEARKVVNCTAAVITDFGSDSEALQVIKNLTKA
mmetsp:Transcript_29411/g.53970  ORF Transcript_29411/g.53970 Transcript_29411/m.53970 type:complete len:139 (-) Transcript_29411:153-569(-)|eukprot:CAMPEP_0175057754 /NCGR_PEP_ID=MMETSP0052_2-20121109/11442_1 /TAXON_ID=51329 ORGANISM="Polytomella parva, Strain SAG 63-3" /NCGR_SAMPLE_ID=MMETSP0052_2 /ASSEMBLY_ACC=CAM_ASM_000194 /LENGTH=138 /DNA_ID=CAMNT_0016323007 /DNA_START=234 /DNA_END=650 /DNA_ORIENTATION=-